MSKISTRSKTVTNDDAEKLEFDLLSLQELSNLLTRGHKSDILDMYNRYDA